MKRSLVVLLMADLVDYTRLMDEDEVHALDIIQELKGELLEPFVVKAGGETLKRMGDGWIFAFASVQTAIECAMQIQTGLAGHSEIKLRTAAHVGEIVQDDTDFYGPGVNLTQRLQTEAPPGGLLVSEDLYRQLTNDFASKFEDAGAFQLKNIAFPVNAYQWRPLENIRQTATGKLPSIAIEAFEFAPDNSETRAVVADLRQQLILRLSKHTGIRIFDDIIGTSAESIYVLKGRLRVAEGIGRLNLSLVIQDGDASAWSKNFEGSTENVIQFCDQLVEMADAELRIQINAFDGARLETLSDDQLSVSELRSRAANLFHLCTVESFGHAKLLLDKAIRANPEDAMALAMRAEAVLMVSAARYQDLEQAQCIDLECDLNNAIEAFPRSDYILYARALYYLIGESNLPGARRDIERCLSLSPNYPWGHFAASIYNLAEGNFSKAVKGISKAIALSESDPFLPMQMYASAVCLLCCDRPDAAQEQIEQAIQIRPNLKSFHKLRAICLHKQGESEAAKAAIARSENFPDKPSMLAPRMPLPSEQNDLLEKLSPTSLASS